MKPRKDKINEATASYHYVSDTFQQFESTKSAIKFMKESNKYSDQDISKLEAKIVSEAKKLCPDKYEWLEGDETVPAGWKYRTVMCSNGNTVLKKLKKNENIHFLSQDWNVSFSWLLMARVTVAGSRLWST